MLFFQVWGTFVTSFSSLFFVIHTMWSCLRALMLWASPHDHEQDVGWICMSEPYCVWPKQTHLRRYPINTFFYTFHTKIEETCQLNYHSWSLHLFSYYLLRTYLFKRLREANCALGDQRTAQGGCLLLPPRLYWELKLGLLGLVEGILSTKHPTSPNWPFVKNRTG